MPEEEGDAEMGEAVLDAQSLGASGWRTALDNYRDLLNLDNGLVWLINVVCVAIGYGIIDQTGGTLGLVAGGFLLLSGGIGIAESIYGRVMA